MGGLTTKASNDQVRLQFQNVTSATGWPPEICCWAHSTMS